MFVLGHRDSDASAALRPTNFEANPFSSGFVRPAGSTPTNIGFFGGGILGFQFRITY